jgi:hypothetical protein
MSSRRYMCDDQAVARPATGKTPVRNLRSPDEVWLPALAKAAAEGTTVTDVVNASLRRYTRSPAARAFTFSEWPEAAEWLDDSYPAWRECAVALIEATAAVADEEYMGVALWLAITRHPADLAQQQRVVTGFLLGRASAVTRGGWRDQYADSRALLRAISTVLGEYLPRRQPAG